MSVDAAAPETRSGTAELLRRYGLLYALLFMFGAEMYLVAPLLPTLSYEYGVATTTAAALVSIYVAVQAVASPLQGLAYPRLGARWMIVGGAALFAAGNVIAALSPGFGWLLASRAMAGLGVSSAGPAIWSWIAHTAPITLRSTAIGAGMGGFAAGQVFGVPIGGLIASQFGWRWSFGAMAVAVALAVPALYQILGHARPQRRTALGLAGQLRELFRAWLPGPTRWTLVITFGFHAANLGAFTYLFDVLAHKYHLDVAQLGYIGALSGAGMCIGSLVAGRILDRVHARSGSQHLVLPAWLIIVGVTVATVFCSQWLWLSLSLIPVWFFAAGAFDTNQQTLIAGSSPGFTTVAMAWNLSVLYAAAAFGVWAMSFGTARTTAVVATSTVLLTISVVIAVVRHAQRRPHLEGQPMENEPDRCQSGNI
ncbi:MFS transporter [Mycobacterium decipiens]|uniref:Major facilitator superfamily (MFS) profile domain-containing protein n=1 Tax=Mycobacterium decipiens TaxID=1430326 RepID=A0A1X2LUJ5_9MYCO|nr:MFS transporter [Mycobacterium decipiens]OSC40650.1 hypothetical protein B8W66_12265 [Mycobacterium decipiens]